MAALPPPGSPGRKPAVEAIVIHVGCGRFAFVARNAKNRERCIAPFPALPAPGQPSPGAGAPSTFRAPVPASHRFRADIVWRLLPVTNLVANFATGMTTEYKNWLAQRILAAAPIPGAPVVALGANLNATLQAWVAFMAAPLAPGLPVPPAPPRNPAISLNLYEARQVLRDAGFVVKNKPLDYCNRRIGAPALRSLFEPHLRAVRATRVRVNASALVPMPSPRDLSSVPGYLRHYGFYFVRTFPSFSFMAVGRFPPETQARLRATMLNASWVIAELRAQGMDGAWP